MFLSTSQRKALQAELEPALSVLAENGGVFWDDSHALEIILQAQAKDVPYCRRLFAVDKSGHQVTASFNRDGPGCDQRGRDLRGQPYGASLYPKRHLVLSHLYTLPDADGYYVAALQPVMEQRQFLGFIACEIALRDLPLEINAVPLPKQHREGDALDPYLPALFAVVEELLAVHGVFHCQIHYVSGQVQLWHRDDPYRYQLHKLTDLLVPGFCAHYPTRAYPAQALLPANQIHPLLERFHLLRCADDQVYLRVSSLNVINARIGLSFSRDGSHYFAAEDFLDKDWAFWEQAASADLTEPSVMASDAEACHRLVT